MSLDYEHAPVTVADERAVAVGATGGIERAIALDLAEEGATTVAPSRFEGRGRRTVSELPTVDRRRSR